MDRGGRIDPFAELREVGDEYTVSHHVAPGGYVPFFSIARADGLPFSRAATYLIASETTMAHLWVYGSASKGGGCFNRIRAYVA